MYVYMHVYTRMQTLSPTPDPNPHFTFFDAKDEQPQE